MDDDRARAMTAVDTAFAVHETRSRRRLARGAAGCLVAPRLTIASVRIPNVDPTLERIGLNHHLPQPTIRPTSIMRTFLASKVAP